jgi:hypothetical protein
MRSLAAGDRFVRGNLVPDAWLAALAESLAETGEKQKAVDLARSGAEWMRTFGRFNSGTYNNMFSVLDTKLFAPNSSATLAAGLLFVGEQMPGAWVFEDRTSWLLSQPGAADGPHVAARHARRGGRDNRGHYRCCRRYARAWSRPRRRAPYRYCRCRCQARFLPPRCPPPPRPRPSGWPYRSMRPADAGVPRAAFGAVWAG